MAYINKNVSTMAMPSGMNRMGQFPLDMSSVYYDLDSLKTYAESGAIAYVGQVVSLVDEENNKVTVYSIQDTAGTLKEVGTVPTGDEDTIVVAADGTISLAGIENLSFTEKDAEGNDVDVTYQALLTKDGLTWVKPSKTTVEGLATLIDGLTVRVKALEDADFATQIANEKKRAEEAEKALEAEVARATKKEGELAELIAGNTAVINSILGNEDEVDLNSIAELAAWITEHGKEATAMAEAIEKNAEDIAANTKKIGEVEASIPGALATTLADYKVKNVDGTTLQLSETGVASIKAVSTDLLTQGVEELVLNGGSAN